MPLFATSKFWETCVSRRWAWRLFLFMIFVQNSLFAQYQKKPPDFGGSHTFPSPTHPEPNADWLRFLDVGLLAIALGLGAWLILKYRSRKGVMWLSIASVAYFGFFRKGCVCSVGAIQNVVLCLVDPHYVISLSVMVIFFLPLLATLFFGRVFCGGVCPLGAIQDLVLLRPLQVPLKLDKALRWLQFVYLGLAVFFAGWGLQLKLGAWQIHVGQRFLICDWDPFIPIFRRSGPFYMVAIGAGFILAGMFIGRPYCRWLCPYGGLLSILSRVAWKNVSITPDKELDCGLCSDSCPYGAIQECRADRAFCLACTRCYDSCPRQKRLMALRAGPRKPVPVAVSPRHWEAVLRTWAGLLAVVVLSICAVWLLATYAHARWTYPAEKALVDSLKQKARNDAEIQKILQPELDRQHKAAVSRRLVYNRGSVVLLVSLAVFWSWFHWFRPKQGAGAGGPAGMIKFLEKPPERRKKPFPLKKNIRESKSFES
jgi:polyferredoxin